ncbi:integrase catalytic domain-containing protein [Haematococcus lacustris]|uniref:Integrase catalytic domain-containing protein n=1 Tax=Haematococcus lacustris TaxID=44745 RepID=A0A699YGE9_HAELA|nr:integrase catalytic domain-containing protein [Haematococcus lacustris]
MINPDGTRSEPTVPERDRALGYGTGATAAPGVSLPQRVAILVVQRMARPVNLDDPVAAAHDLPERSAVLHRETVAAMGNIRIAQHHDTLRYAITHSGSYKPTARQLHPGSFVWTQRPQATTFQLGARPEIYRVISLGDNGVARLGPSEANAVPTIDDELEGNY